MQHLIDVKDCDDFRTLIENGKKIVLFTAEWYKPGLKIKETLNMLAKESDTKFLVVDTDNLSKLRSECNISGMSTLIFYENSMKIDVYIGKSIPYIKIIVQKFLYIELGQNSDSAFIAPAATVPTSSIKITEKEAQEPSKRRSNLKKTPKKTYEQTITRANKRRPLNPPSNHEDQEKRIKIIEIKQEHEDPIYSNHFIPINNEEEIITVPDDIVAKPYDYILTDQNWLTGEHIDVVIDALQQESQYIRIYDTMRIQELDRHGIFLQDIHFPIIFFVFASVTKHW
jgi:hypothetical protein